MARQLTFFAPSSQQALFSRHGSMRGFLLFFDKLMFAEIKSFMTIKNASPDTGEAFENLLIGKQT